MHALPSDGHDVVDRASSSSPKALREDLERMKRVRLHRGLRHYWGIHGASARRFVSAGPNVEEEI